MDLASEPLNGEKTHPLSDHALSELRRVVQRPVPRSQINPGVIGRLLRDDLVVIELLTSPFPSHRGRKVAHVLATRAGAARLEETRRP